MRRLPATHVIGAATLGAKGVARRVLPHPVYRVYRQRRIARQIAMYPEHVVTHRYGGHVLKVLLADPLAEGWYDKDWRRLPELDELSRIGALRAGATVFDIGAHQGVVALMLASEVGVSGTVVAVEAEPHNATLARRNIALNDARNVLVVHAAIADRPGTVHFAEGLNGHVDDGTRRGNVEVPAVTIDQLAQQHGPPDLVFLDVEGYEGKALQGAAATLGSGRTSFFVEVHVEQLVDCDVDAIAGFFADYDISAAEEPSRGFEPLHSRARPSRFFLVAAPSRPSI